MNDHTTKPAAILWDMDGTLIDSEPHWIQAETKLCAEHGVTWTQDDGLAIIGRPLRHSAQVLRSRGVDRDIDEIVDRLVDYVSARVRESVPWQEDSRRLFDRALTMGIPCALVTMSYQKITDALTDQVPGFAVVVSGDLVTNGKPHPEPYLTAAELLGVPIDRCLAIEDSAPGVASAYASGARTVAVTRLSPIDSRPGLSRIRNVDSLTDETISAILNGAVIDDFVGKT